jgi:hypothetical protein
LQSGGIVVPQGQIHFAAFDVNMPVVMNHQRQVDHRLLCLDRLLRLYPIHLMAGALRPAGPVDGAHLAEGH